MGKIIRRLLELPDTARHSVFLWGPRRAGKSWWIRENLPEAPRIDLLQTDVYTEYASRPSLLRERYAARLSGPRRPIVIDEVQKLPILLDEVHWLIENAKRTFVLTGSSARKLRRGHANLLAGRARRREMPPLCFPEVDRYDPERLAVSGLLPPHYLSDDPLDDIRSYVNDYLKEEIVAEGVAVSLPAFSDFLRVAAITSSELLNYTNVAREVGVSAKIVRGYFDLLEDTLLGFRVAPWTKSRNRRLILTPKFYLFDAGVANFLARRRPEPGTPEFGKTIEHLVLMELMAWRAYRDPDMEIRYWRASTGQEIDFLVNDREVAIDVKASARVPDHALRSLGVLAEDGPVRRRIVVCLERQPRVVADRRGEIAVLPLAVFLERLWGGTIVAG
ncbi:MAG: ATP-binding protein [Acidobacteria bacterium]|nr:ATP-binding protein [Acidobacteriota bacterium]